MTKYVMVAKEKFYYDGKEHNVGDEFHAVDPDANILHVLGKAEKLGTQAPTAKKPSPLQTSLQTAAVKAEEPNDEQPMGRRRYLRRDMTADE